MSQGSAYGIPIDTDGTLSANSDFLVPSQKAVKTYVDTEIAAIPVPTTPDLEDVLTQGNDGGGLEITNIADGTAASSAATVGQVNQRSRILDSQFNLTTTATVAEEILYSFEIPAGTLGQGDMLEIHFFGRKTSGTGANTVKFYLNSSNVVGGGGATQYGQLATSSVLNQTFAPRVLMDTDTSQIGYPGTAGVLWGNIGGTYGTGALSNASSIWVQVTNTKAVAGDAYIYYAVSTILHKSE